MIGIDINLILSSLAFALVVSGIIAGVILKNERNTWLVENIDRINGHIKESGYSLTLFVDTGTAEYVRYSGSPREESTGRISMNRAYKLARASEKRPLYEVFHDNMKPASYFKPKKYKGFPNP